MKINPYKEKNLLKKGQIIDKCRTLYKHSSILPLSKEKYIQMKYNLTV